MASRQVVRYHNQIHVFPCLLATRVQLEKHGSVSSAAIPAVGVVSSRERREPLAQRRTRRTYIKSGRHESDAACAYPYSPRRELNRRGGGPGRGNGRFQPNQETQRAG